MRIIARRTLREFWEQRPDVEQPLKAWLAETSNVSREAPQAIKDQYRHASFVADNGMIFTIGGNQYRRVVHVNYGHSIVFIKFVGTHSEYDRIDPETV